MSEEIKKMDGERVMGTLGEIDITPKWSGICLMLAEIYGSGFPKRRTLGDKERESASIELLKMAAAADNWNRVVKEAKENVATKAKALLDHPPE